MTVTPERGNPLKTIGKATFAAPVKASFDAPTSGPLHMTSVLNLMALRLRDGFSAMGEQGADLAPLTADLADTGATIGA